MRSNTPSKFGLLDLPPEIRHLIYDFVFEAPHCTLLVLADLRLIRVHHGLTKPINNPALSWLHKLCVRVGLPRAKSTSTPPWLHELPRNLPALLRTCRQINQEASPVLRDAASFTVVSLSRNTGPTRDFVERHNGKILVLSYTGLLVAYLVTQETIGAYVVFLTVLLVFGSLLPQRLPRACAGCKYDARPNKVLWSGAMGPTSILRSARRVHMVVDKWHDGWFVKRMASWIPDLLALFDASGKGSLRCTIEFGDSSFEPGTSVVLFGAFSAITCKERR
ncbi:hypothetical protein EJ03DRAFT_354313 [Teratosphaeria nubilosa]|uniref:F-box domain-containing protein n=1 Tax=Teratosphaeria nubilosa TaxID=161662 RepID=A0A6G1KZG1_9PEZI|nr:hypothetical protein EJ03DRAFT_354313 [Teratosphaeria nubilosa]